MKLIDTFCGIGGFSLAAHAVGIETVLFCDSKEHSPYVWQVIPRHFPGVVLHDDVRTLTREVVDDALADALGDGRVEGWQGRRPNGMAREEGAADGGTRGEPALPSEYRGEGLILTAGFPCQDISYAGKGAGLDGDRSGLFFEVARLADELRPRYLLLENVAALLTRGLDAVLGTLASLGYDACWACIPACAVGAPHRRDRIWIVATPTDDTSAARLQRIYERVLASLTPFGRDTWVTPNAMDSLPPREWGSDAYERMLRRGDPNGTRRAGSGNLREQVTEPIARGDTWPTPTVDDAGNVTRDSGAFPSLTRASRECWPTPSANEDAAGTPAGKMQKMLGNHPGVRGETTEEWARGSLNPDWVETLMGYPIGYTRPEGAPMTELPGVWPSGEWPTPAAQEPQWKHLPIVDGSGNTPQHPHQRWYHADTGRLVQKGLEQVITHGWPAGLGAPQHDWEPPRLTTVKENRANRLKALGNSIVPAVARLWLAAIKEEIA